MYMRHLFSNFEIVSTKSVFFYLLAFITLFQSAIGYVSILIFKTYVFHKTVIVLIATFWPFSACICKVQFSPYVESCESRFKSRFSLGRSLFRNNEIFFRKSRFSLERLLHRNKEIFYRIKTVFFFTEIN